jgi:transcriptional regulator with XRE-family HTH domain
LRSLTNAIAGRRTLDRIHLRVYTCADYLQRWQDRFGSIIKTTETSPPVSDVGPLQSLLEEKGITAAKTADDLKIDRSFLSKILKGKKPAPAQLLKRLRDYLQTAGDEGEGDDFDVDALRTIQRHGISQVEAALAYRRLGWSVIPMRLRSKRSHVYWKRFQRELPSEQLIHEWWTKWPNAGIAVVLGSISRLLVVDVDGTEAHEMLISRLAAEPLAPKALSGSRRPNRYHLYFRHPPLVSKAKATPWHPKLEFRGNGGLVVLPPSNHSSGNEYVWAAGRAIGQVPLPTLPLAVSQALSNSRRPISYADRASEPVACCESLPCEVSRSTAAFLSGRYMNGPKWNDRLYRAACDCHGRGISIETAEPLLLAGAKPSDHVEENNARRTIESAYSVPAEPGVI